MEIRFMEERDLDQVTALEAACFSQPWKRNDFKDILTNPDRFYMVAADGDVIAQYEGQIDIEANDGGYIKFDFEGKRYMYYNCFVESIADIE